MPQKSADLNWMNIPVGTIIQMLTGWFISVSSRCTASPCGPVRSLYLSGWLSCCLNSFSLHTGPAFLHFLTLTSNQKKMYCTVYIFSFYLHALYPSEREKSFLHITLVMPHCFKAASCLSSHCDEAHGLDWQPEPPVPRVRVVGLGVFHTIILHLLASKNLLHKLLTENANTSAVCYMSSQEE